EDEIPTLRKYKEQAERNGVLELQWLTRDDMAALEPNVLAVAGLLSPSTGIIDSHGLMLAYQGDAEARGASIVFQSPVLGGEAHVDGTVLRVGGSDPMALGCEIVVNAAGLTAPAVS